MRTMLDPVVISNWHTHPRGQILYVLSGVGHTQREGGQSEEIRTRDCVWFAPNERHWHGASATAYFHI
jgi:quercetin dioxygenase-like cupin family protein